MRSRLEAELYENVAYPIRRGAEYENEVADARVVSRFGDVPDTGSSSSKREDHATNGLKVYLSGDTGLTKDMRDIVNAYYGPSLSVINISDTFVTGPEEAAFAITNLLRTRAVIPSHANEAATRGGVVASGTRTERFTQLASQGLSVDTLRDALIGRQSVSVYLPLSGVTMEFDGSGRCFTGCQGR